MTHYREDAHRPIGDVGSSAFGWLFALAIAAVLAIGAWYVLATSGTHGRTNASMQTGLLSAAVAQVPLKVARAA